MIKKKMSLEIKGKNVELNFGVNYFYEFFKEDSGQDLVANPRFDIESLQSLKVFDFTQSLIWAGYQSECAVREISPELTKADIKHFVMSKTDGDAMDVLYELIACMSGMSVEEIKNAETQAAKP